MSADLYQCDFVLRIELLPSMVTVVDQLNKDVSIFLIVPSWLPSFWSWPLNQLRSPAV